MFGKHVLVAIVLVALAAVVSAGEVKPVATDAQHGIQPRNFYAYQELFRKPADRSGTVNPNAVVAVTRPPMPVAIAIDSAEPDAAAPDVIRFDFTGKGVFTSDNAVPLKPVGQGRNVMDWQFGPAEVTIRRGETAVPARVQGNYHRRESYRYLNFTVGTALEGQCEITGATYTVRIVDADGNLTPGDRAEPIVRSGALCGRSAGDSLLLVGPNGKTDVYVYGQPIRIDDAWYDVKLTDDRASVSAEKLDLPTGSAHIDHDDWSILMVSKDCVFWHRGGAASFAVPAGEYFVAEYTENVRSPDGRRQVGQINIGTNSGPGTSARIDPRGHTLTVKSGETAELAIGSPLTAWVTARDAGSGRYVLSLEETDAAGIKPAYVMRSGETPKVRILDAEGAEVYKCTLEYG